MTEPGQAQSALPEASLSLRTVKGAGWVIAWRLATRNLGLLSTLVLARLLVESTGGLPGRSRSG